MAMNRRRKRPPVQGWILVAVGHTPRGSRYEFECTECTASQIVNDSEALQPCKCCELTAMLKLGGVAVASA